MSDLSAAKSDFMISWVIPSFRDYVSQRICSSECRHRSGLAFQIVSGPFRSHYAVSLQCNNIASIISPTGHLEVTFQISMGPVHPQPGCHFLQQSSGFTMLSSKFHSTITLPQCHEFASMDALQLGLDKLSDKAAMKVTCQLSIRVINPQDAADSQDLNSITLQVLEKGDDVAVRADKSEPKGFWLAKLLEPVTTTSKLVSIIWYNESEHAKYELMSNRDRVHVGTIHPEKVTLYEVSNGKFMLNINPALAKRLRQYSIKQK